MIQADVYAVLSGSSAISAIASTNIYPLRLPQDADVPAVVYTIRNIDPVKSLDGESGLDSATVEIVCWAKTYMTAHLLAAAVRAAFVEDDSGTFTGDMQDIEDEETRNYGVVLNMSVWSESNINRSANMG